MKSFLTFISTVLFLIPLVLIVNFLGGIVDTSLEGTPVFFPIGFCTFGFLVGMSGYRKFKTKWLLTITICNAVLFFFPFVYMIGGTLLFGV